MSLSVGDNTANNVNCGTGSTLNNLDVGTALMWIYPNSVANSARNYCGKSLLDGGWEVYKRGTDGTILRFGHARATTGMVIDSPTATLSANSWQYYGISWDLTTSGNCVMYKGTLSSMAADVGATVNMGSGASADDSGTALRLMSNSVPGSSAAHSMAWFGLWNRVLTASEIRDQQFHPHITSGCVLFMHLGFNGTGTQPDWSGNGNSGTVTGATVADHVPLGPYFGFDLWKDIKAPSGVMLTVQDMAQAQTVESPTLTQHNALAVDNLAQAQTVENVGLTQHNVLVAQDMAQAQTVENVTVTYHAPGGVTLTVQDMAQAQTVEAVTLTQHNTLAVDNLAQAQTVENVTVIYHAPGAVTLTVQDMAQAQTVEAVTLTQHNTLVVQDLAQAQTLDNIAFYVAIIELVLLTRSFESTLDSRDYELDLQARDF